MVQWPGLVCLGPAGVYRGTAHGILGLLGARPYEDRAARRLAQWPFESR